MLRKFLRLFHTLRYIKGIQLRYQVWYRLKNRFISIHWYKKYSQRNFIVLDLQVATILQSKQTEYSSNNTFEFIGLKQSFGDRVDWNYLEHGKLWNYNLQYLSYLLDESIQLEERLRLLSDFSHQLLSSIIQPEPYPVSLRIVNTLLFHSRYPISDPVILEALQKQIDYLAHNLEYHLLANHLLENAFSLFIASVYLTDQPLYEKSYQLLTAQLHEQILTDGGHYECSPMYQSILLGKLFLCIDVAKQSSIATQSEIKSLSVKAAQMLGWMNAYSFPDGSWALMNDAAEGVAPTTECLNLAANYLNITSTDVYLSSSGFRKLKGNDWEVLIKTGPVQPFFQPGHVHADILSFCLWYQGKQIIVDPGTSTYSISGQRNKERGTSAHNTITINGNNQSDVWSGFRVGKRAFVHLVYDRENHIEAVVIPYFNREVKHFRRFKKINDYQFVIEDNLSFGSPSKYICKGGLQFGDGVQVQRKENSLLLQGVFIEFSGIENVLFTKSTYASSYNYLYTVSRLEYVVPVSSHFSFKFS